MKCSAQAGFTTVTVTGYSKHDPGKQHGASRSRAQAQLCCLLGGWPSPEPAPLRRAGPTPTGAEGGTSEQPRLVGSSLPPPAATPGPGGGHGERETGSQTQPGPERPQGPALTAPAQHEVSPRGPASLLLRDEVPTPSEGTAASGDPGDSPRPEVGEGPSGYGVLGKDVGVGHPSGAPWQAGDSPGEVLPGALRAAGRTPQLLPLRGPGPLLQGCEASMSVAGPLDSVDTRGPASR